ncbi:phage baseplate assembly protein V [Azospirillum halopraeferens]|uniref:phage baseplate assembly protein V n=1 Tax=Azospirillum halopraeferens TaxID=34010 RepID=UPI0003F5ED00|nr:phage baseplate assembly protein V [Azospirillum halopraeferens]
MYRRAIVEAVDAATARVRVHFPDADGMVSWWLEVLQQRTLGDRSYWMPDVGEAVAVLMDERDEAGVVLGAIYSAADPPPVTSADTRHTVHRDGAVFEYDRAAHTWTVAVPTGGRIAISVGGTSLVMDDAGARVVAPRIDLN